MSPPAPPSSGAGRADDAQRLRAAVQEFIRSFGLLSGDHTPCGEPVATSHAHALVVLLDAGRAGERISQQALASALGIDKSNVTRLCAKMERLGHIDQERPATDGRARLVGLTIKGERVGQRIESASRGRFQEVLAALPSGHERENVIIAVQRLNEAVAAVTGKQANA